jgi:integrase
VAGRKRRGRGEGGIRLRPDGRWEASIDRGWKDGKRDRRCFYGGTRADVAEKLRRAQAQTDRGLPLGDKRTTVAVHLEHWLTLQQRSAKAVNTVAQYEWAIRKHLVPKLGHRRLVDLTAEHVDDFLGAEAEAGYSRNSLMRMRSVLVQALDQAVKRDALARNVAVLTDTPDGPASAGRTLTREQASALVDAVAGDRLEAAFITMLMLGVRPGETLGLPWDDVDLDAGNVRIRQALKVERGVPVIGQLKTAGSRRTLALPAPVSDALRAQRRRQLADRMAAGPAWSDSGLVFTTAIGTPLAPRNFRRSFDRLTRRAGLGHWHPNELRHSFTSLCSAAGVRLEDVADMLGHTTTRMTSQVYRHQVTPTISAGKEAMERLFGASGELGGQFGGQTVAGDGGPAAKGD